MKTAICDMLGIDFPLLAFSHCRDVVAAVTNAEGSACWARHRTPASSSNSNSLDHEHVDDRPYGVDIVCPKKNEGKGGISRRKRSSRGSATR